MTPETWQTTRTVLSTNCPSLYFTIGGGDWCHALTGDRARCTFEYCPYKLFTYVEDGLPDPGVEVLAAWSLGKETTILKSSHHIDDSDGWWSCGYTYVMLYWRVYAWTPLPEAPPVRGE